ALERRWALEADDEVGAGAADELGGGRGRKKASDPFVPGQLDGAGDGLAANQFAFAFDHQLDGLADQLAVDFVADLLLDGEELVVAAALRVLGDVVGEAVDCGGA